MKANSITFDRIRKSPYKEYSGFLIGLDYDDFPNNRKTLMITTYRKKTNGIPEKIIAVNSYKIKNRSNIAGL